MRLRLDIAYDGTEFHGWAAQRGLRTVQELGGVDPPRAAAQRAGQPDLRRPDGRRGARPRPGGYLDLPDVTDVPKTVAELSYRLRNVLPSDLVVRRVSLAPPGFDARFLAIWRHYVYRIADSTPDPLLRIRHCAAHRTRPAEDQRGRRQAARAARLRGLLQAARGRHHDPQSAATVARRTWGDVAEITVS